MLWAKGFPASTAKKLFASGKDVDDLRNSVRGAPYIHSLLIGQGKGAPSERTIQRWRRSQQVPTASQRVGQKWSVSRRRAPPRHMGNRCQRTNTLSVLWWEGLGVVIQRSTPPFPRQNATVEGLQGICARWVGPKDQLGVEALQEALDEQNGSACSSVFLQKNGSGIRAWNVRAGQGSGRGPQKRGDIPL